MVMTQKQNNNQQFLLDEEYSGQENLSRTCSVLGKILCAWTSLWKELNRGVTLKICLLFSLPSYSYPLGILLSKQLQLITQPILKIYFRKVSSIHKLNIICINLLPMSFCISFFPGSCFIAESQFSLAYLWQVDTSQIPSHLFFQQPEYLG